MGNCGTCLYKEECPFRPQELDLWGTEERLDGAFVEGAVQGISAPLIEEVPTRLGPKLGDCDHGGYWKQCAAEFHQFTASLISRYIDVELCPEQQVGCAICENYVHADQ